MPRWCAPLLLGGLWALAGCAFHVEVSGLVDPPRKLRLYDGSELRLWLDEESAPIQHLEGCVVYLEGNRFGKNFAVKDWYVQDAGFGYGAYVGILRVVGTRVLLDDRRTNTTLVLDPLSAIALRDHNGVAVLIVGPLVGPSEIQAVTWRLLTERPTERLTE